MNKKREQLLLEADMYRLLSLSFAYPDRETEDVLRSLFEDLGEVICQFPADIREKFHACRNSLGGSSAETREEDFTELFMTRMLCPPYENSYGKIGFNKTGNLADINGFYKAFGFSLSDKDSDMPDHIAIETEFLSLLALKEAYGLERNLAEMTEVCLSAKKNFLKDHLGRWVGIFSKNLADRTANDFYRNLARLTAAFIAAETAWYGIAVETAEGLLLEPEEPVVCPVAGGDQSHVDHYESERQ